MGQASTHQPAYPGQPVPPIRPVHHGSRHPEALLDTGHTASMLLDTEGRLLARNSAAEALLLASDALYLRNEQVVPVDAWKRRAFTELLHAWRKGARADRWGVLLLDRPGDKRPLQIVLTPAMSSGVLVCADTLLLLAIDPEQPVVCPEPLLRQLYGFTSAEAAVANSLLHGLCLQEIAVARRVSLTTVRSQMKTILGKTNTSRQTDLVRLLLKVAHALPFAQHA